MMISAQLVLRQLLALGAWLLCSLLFWNGLAPLSWLLYLSLLPFIYAHFRKIEITKDNVMGWALFLGYGFLVWYWLKDIWFVPSNDDGVNHLALMQSILNSHHVLLGQVDRPGSEWFGQIRNYFYPTGSHGLAALWIYPWTNLFPWPALFKIFVIVTIALWPALLWWGSLYAFPTPAWPLRLFLVIAATTQPIFPSWSLGEGGVSRIIAGVIFVPLWFEVLGGQHWRFRSGFAWTAFIAPLFLFIHPSLLPLLAVAILFFRRGAFVGAVVGSLIGGVVFYFIMHSAQQPVLMPGFLENLVSDYRTDLFGWFDRLKGPFHYWFSDPMGFGKFMSLKNIFIFLGVILALVGKVPQKVFLIFLIPFAMAALALIPHPWAQQLGLIYYHAAKRISELTPLLGFTLACFAAEWISKKEFSKNLWRRFPNAVIGVLLICVVAWSFIYVNRSSKSLNEYHALYNTPMKSKVEELVQKTQNMGANDTLIIDRHDYDILRFAMTQRVLTIKPECGEVGTPSSYCVKRRAYGVEQFAVTSRGVTAPAGTWWLPAAADDAVVLKMAQDQKRTIIELAEDAHLISLVKSAPNP